MQQLSRLQIREGTEKIVLVAYESHLCWWKASHAREMWQEKTWKNGGKTSQEQKKGKEAPVRDDKKQCVCFLSFPFLLGPNLSLHKYLKVRNFSFFVTFFKVDMKYGIIWS